MILKMIRRLLGMERTESRLAEFQRIARENGMTYRELQVLETLGKVKIRKGELVRLDERKG